QCEEALLPETPFKIALSYASVSKVWMRLGEDPQGTALERPWESEHGEWLAGQKAIKEWSVELPDDGDLNTHLAELPVEQLPFGRFAILVSTAQTFTPKKDLIVYANVICTRLALSERRKKNVFDLLVLDRW